MLSTAQVLAGLASYLERHPGAWANTSSPAALIPVRLRGPALEALREEIGAPGVMGSITMWARTHTCSDFIDLVRRAAKHLTSEPT